MVLKLDINKELQLYSLVMLYLLTYSLSVKTREPKNEQLCITVHPINNNIRGADPLDNSSSKTHINLHCLT